MTTIKTLPVTTNQVAAALRITPDRHIELYFDLGYDYLLEYQADTARRIPADRHSALNVYTHTFIASPVFWFWWKLEWERTDRVFLASGKRSVDEYLHAQRNRVSVPSQEVIDQVIRLARNNHKHQMV